MNKEQITELLTNITPEELNVLSKLLNALGKKDDINDDPNLNLTTTKPKRKRKRKTPKVIESTKDIDENNDGIVGLKRNKPISNSSKRGKSTPIIERFYTGPRPDLFVEEGYDKLEKDDIEIDKKLNAGRKPTPRNKRKTTINICCKKCNKEYTVNRQLIFNDPDDGPSYICDRCIGR